MQDEYLGDGLYVSYDIDTGTIELAARDGISATNVVYLEPEVLQNFMRYCERLFEEQRRAAQEWNEQSAAEGQQ
jgi:hypothetical protein